MSASTAGGTAATARSAARCRFTTRSPAPRLGFAASRRAAEPPGVGTLSGMGTGAEQAGDRGGREDGRDHRERYRDRDVLYRRRNPLVQEPQYQLHADEAEDDGQTEREVHQADEEALDQE